LWSSAVVEGGGDSGGVILPSLMSPLFLFSAPLSSVFPLSSLLLLCLFVVVSAGWRWQCQRRSGGVLWRWRGSTVAAVVVLLLWYIFFSSVTPLSLLCHCFSLFFLFLFLCIFFSF
jgi:hypothetical protein